MNPIQSRMTTTAALAFWARHHRTNARFLIAFATTLLVMAGSALGNLWMHDGLHLGLGVLAAIFATYLIIFPLYPLVRRRTNWVRRKAFDAVLIGCTALLGVWLGAEGERTDFGAQLQTAQAATVSPSQSPNARPNITRRFERRVQRGMSLLKLIFPRPARFGDPYIFSDGEKIGLTALTVILMLGLMFVILMASCSLSCSGNAVGGGLVLLLGWTAVATLGVLAIVRINRNADWMERRAHRRAEQAEREAHRRSTR